MKLKELLEGDIVNFDKFKKNKKVQAPDNPVKSVTILKPGEPLPAGAKPMSFKDAFWPLPAKIIVDSVDEHKVTWAEKPISFNEIRGKQHYVTYIELEDDIEPALKKAGIRLPVLTAEEVFGGIPKHPMVNAKPTPDVFILTIKGERYICWRAANTYIRMWLWIDDEMYHLGAGDPDFDN